MLENILKKANLSDVIIVLISSIAIVGFWRGTWNILDKFLFPSNFILSQASSIVLGILILIILARHK